MIIAGFWYWFKLCYILTQMEKIVKCFLPKYLIIETSLHF